MNKDENLEAILLDHCKLWNPSDKDLCNGTEIHLKYRLVKDVARGEERMFCSSWFTVNLHKPQIKSFLRERNRRIHRRPFGLYPGSNSAIITTNCITLLRNPGMKSFQ